MLYELRTYNLTANSVPEVERRFAEKIEARMELSPLVGFWHTDIGRSTRSCICGRTNPLQHRADTRAKAIADKVWPPDITEFIVSMESDILTPSPVNDPLDGPREWGNLYELRMYTYPSGAVRSIMQQFTEQAPRRLALSPGCFFASDLGQLNRFYQLWPVQGLGSSGRDEEGVQPGHLAAAHRRAPRAATGATHGSGGVLSPPLRLV